LILNSVKERGSNGALHSQLSPVAPKPSAKADQPYSDCTRSLATRVNPACFCVKEKTFRVAILDSVVHSDLGGSMQRRSFLKGLVAILFQATLWNGVWVQAAAKRLTARRVRPSDAAWPGAAQWRKLKDAVDGNLIKVRSLFADCEADRNGAACLDASKNVNNPYYIGDQPAGTQISGWLDAWSPAPSAYAIAARNSADVAAGVNFARENNLRLVVKGGGHSYQGTSNAPDSLLVWTRKMNKVVLHDAFVSRGCERHQKATPAVTIEAGAVWMDVYDAVTTKAGRYVQGGGCATVGVAGLIQSGGFGSFSKMFGLACAGLLEAEVVTADGHVRIASACTNPDLFWGLKGGGGGTFGIVTKVTLQTHELPKTFGDVSVTIKAKSDAAFRKLIVDFLRFYSASLFNPHWGESVNFRRSNTLSVNMVFAGLDKETAEGLWRQFLADVTKDSETTITSPFAFEIMPAKDWWDIDYLEKYSVGSVTLDKRLDAPKTHAWWTGDGEQVGTFMHAYQSRWLSAALLKDDARERLAEALFVSSRNWSVSLHFNKGLAGAPPEVVAAAKETAMNPAVADAFALAIVSGSGPAAYPGLPRSSPDVSEGRADVAQINKALAQLRNIAPNTGSYGAEGDYFDQQWQASFWGENYPRLRDLKQKFDPNGLFFVHHGVGSEEWSADGFTRLTNDRG
jgi:FAD/FMN-containing dehydrogenase